MYEDEPKKTRRGLLKSDLKDGIQGIRKNYVEVLVKSEFKNMKDWAKASNIRYGTFFRYSTGSTLPRVDVAMRIAEIAGASVDELYGDRSILPMEAN